MADSSARPVWVSFRRERASFGRAHLLRFHLSGCRFIGPNGEQVRARVNLGDFAVSVLIVLSIIGLLIGLAVIYEVIKWRRIEAARGKQKSFVPLTSDTVTHSGHS